jgi:hypothetical protein
MKFSALVVSSRARVENYLKPATFSLDLLGIFAAGGFYYRENGRCIFFVHRDPEK